MKIDKTTGISIGALIAIIPLIAGAVIWYDKEQTAEHVVIEAEAVAGDVQVAQSAYVANRDVELELIEAKLKMYRMLREHRALTPDEEADEEWLKKRKSILLEEKRERRA